jgi:hypothetical protein
LPHVFPPAQSISQLHAFRWLAAVTAMVLVTRSAAAADPADRALQPPAIITEPGPQYADARRDMNMVIGMDRTPGGRLWAAWVSGGDSELGYFVCATSDDGGKTWSGPRLVIDPPEQPGQVPARTLVGNFWTDPTGRLWLFFDLSLGFFDGRGGAWAITCDNPDADKPTWSAPRRIWHGATLNKPVVLKDGTWLMPISLWGRGMINGTTEKHRPTIDKSVVPADFKNGFRDLDEQRMAHWFASNDQGKTWTRRGGVAFPKFNFDEHMAVELADGRLWMLARTNDGLFESYSADQAKTWSPPALRFPCIPARFFLRRLASGRLLLIKHGKIDERTPRRSHLTAMLSDDDGKTWKGGLVIDDRAGISYPDGFQAPDGTIQIIYDFDRYGAAEILTCRFTEEDILSNKFQSPNAASRVVVNKAR